MTHKIRKPICIHSKTTIYLVITRKDLVITRYASRNYEKIISFLPEKISILRENYLVITRKLYCNYKKIIS